MEERTHKSPMEPLQGQERRRKKERKKERKEEERERRVGALFCVEVMPYPSMLRSHARKDGVTP
jgi:hypothetical protein